MDENLILIVIIERLTRKIHFDTEDREHSCKKDLMNSHTDLKLRLMHPESVMDKLVQRSKISLEDFGP
jgi:hypothetical protein